MPEKPSRELQLLSVPRRGQRGMMVAADAQNARQPPRFYKICTNSFNHHNNRS